MGVQDLTIKEAETYFIANTDTKELAYIIKLSEKIKKLKKAS